MSAEPQEISQVTYEQLAALEDEFEEIDTQISTSISSHRIPRLPSPRKNPPEC